MENGLVMLTVGDADELRSHVDGGRAGVLLAGPTPDLVSSAHEALLRCDEVVPLVRLLGVHDQAVQQAAVRLDHTLSAETLAVALGDAAAVGH